MEHAAQAWALLEKLGKIHLGFYPTPFHRLDRISKDLGVDLWVKREDFSGTTLFGGNKIRKLEYLLADAASQGCDTVFTYGATQSNHAMETATAARRCGMTPVLFLGAIVEPKGDDVRANLLLDTILGAEIHILKSVGSTRETMAANAALFEARKRELEAEGHRVYDVPIGGSTPRGAAGFADCYIETMEQAEAAGLSPDYLFTCTGSGGTLAGLAAGKALLHDEKTKLAGIAVGKKDPLTYGAGIAEKAGQVLELLGAPERADESLFSISHSYVGPGYEKPFAEANDDIRYLARTEGLFADPVYSGKAFHGMLEEIRRGAVPQGSTVVFLHTGGATALFSEADIIGDLNELR